MSDFVRNVLIERRNRMVGSLMRHIETKVYPKLTAPERDQLRQKVLESVGVYHDICLDMLKASVDDGAVVDEDALRIMADLHSEVRNLRRELHDAD